MTRGMKLRDLEGHVRAILDHPREDPTLRLELEEIAASNWRFSCLIWLWGPELYRRNPVLFRPLILAHFNKYTGDTAWKLTKWDQRLDDWLSKAEAAGDVELSRRLIDWKLSERSQPATARRWRQELLRRINAAPTPAARHVELQKLAIGGYLDEPTALALYALDPVNGEPFIRRFAPVSYWLERVFWEKLIQKAREQGNEDFAGFLYRRQVGASRWEKDALDACRRLANLEQLDAELTRLHPEFRADLGGGFVKMLELRGRDVVPFVIRHIASVRTGIFGRGDFGAVSKLAFQRGWWDLWAAAVRTCASTKEFNADLDALLSNSGIPDAEVRRRLLDLTGVSREWNMPGLGLAVVHDLDEKVALKLYERFPNLLRGPYKLHLQARFGVKKKILIERLIGAGEDDLVDFIASRYTTYLGWNDKVPEEVDILADYYLQMRDDQRGFGRRAASVLGRIPAFAIWRHTRLIKRNRLARLLFERSTETYLDDPQALADLVEASEIHVMELAYRALALDDPRAREQAVRHLPLLLGTLLRPLHRRTRQAAFGALANAATTSPQAASAILKRAREALALPDRKYPKEKLVALIGRLLHAWPELRSVREQPVIYSREASAA